MGEKCLPDELRTLFLFEALTDEQLQMLCENGHIADLRARPDLIEGDPATCFYVLLDGELVMSKRSGGVDIETNRTSQRGVYCGAWSAYIPGEEHVYAGIGPGDQAVAVLRAGRRRVRPVHADRVPDGRAPARGTHGRRPAAAPDHRPAGEAAGARALSPPASPISSTIPLRPPPARWPTCARVSAGCATSWRCWPTASSPPRRCACWSASRTRSPSRSPSPRPWNSPRWRHPTARTRSATGSRTTTSSAPGTTRRRSSTPAWTSTGWNAFRRRSTRSTRRRRCRAPSAG